MRLTGSGLGCQREGRMIFSNVDFTVYSGQILVLRGANGIGKSTLLKIMSGILEPSYGRLIWYGGAPLHQSIHWVSHAGGLKNHLGAIENIACWSWLAGLDLSAGLMKKAGFSTRPVATLSTGQRRRLILERLRLGWRGLWLLDEPTAHLDKSMAQWVVDAVRCHCQGDVTNPPGMAVVATHAGDDLWPEADVLDLGARSYHRSLS